MAVRKIKPVLKAPMVSEDAEAALIGCALLSTTTKKVGDITPDMFALPPNRIIWTAIQGVESPDLVTVSQYLRDRSQLEASGGEDYLINCCEGVGSMASAEAYATIVRSKYKRRTIYDTAKQMATLAGDPEASDEAAVSALRELQKQVNQGGGGSLFAFDEIEDRDAIGVESSFHDINEATGVGYVSGQTSYICAYTGAGKTAFMVNEAADMALRGVYVMYATFADLDRYGVKARALKGMFGRSRRPDYEDLIDLADWDYQVSELGRRFSVYEASVHGRTVEALAAYALKWRDSLPEGAQGVIYADYIQRIHTGHQVDGTRERMERVSEALKITAEDVELPFIIGSQITRSERGRDKTEGTRTWVTKHANAIEEDAGLIVGITTDWTQDPAEPEITLYKNRFGPSGVSIGAKWVSGYARYMPML